MVNARQASYVTIWLGCLVKKEVVNVPKALIGRIRNVVSLILLVSRVYFVLMFAILRSIKFV